MRFIFTLLSSLAITAFLSAQTLDTNGGEHKNSVHVWAGGAGFIYSVNYERLLLNVPEIKLGAEVGAGLYPSSSGIAAAWIPLHLNMVLFRGQHHLELGSGVVLTTEFFQKKEFASFDPSYFLNFRLGYRYQTSNGRYIFRAAFSPFFEPHYRNNSDLFGSSKTSLKDITNRIHPWGGIAFGYAF